jgi:hypothetical protein
MPWLLIGTFILLDTLAMGVGMGVPFFCILLGFILGGTLGWRWAGQDLDGKELAGRSLRVSLLAGGFTFILLIPIWVPLAFKLGDPTFDYANFGIPMILYDPKASFIGWLVLMQVISPFLQSLTTLFGILSIYRLAGRNLPQVRKKGRK